MKTSGYRKSIVGMARHAPIPHLRGLSMPRASANTASWSMRADDRSANSGSKGFARSSIRWSQRRYFNSRKTFLRNRNNGSLFAIRRNKGTLYSSVVQSRMRWIGPKQDAARIHWHTPCMSLRCQHSAGEGHRPVRTTRPAGASAGYQRHLPADRWNRIPKRAKS